MTDYYSVLNIEKSATPKEIKTAYRNLSLIPQPDKGCDAETFKKVTEAYTILSDPETREQYDNPQPEFGGMDGFFEQMFSGFGGRSQKRQQRCEDVQISVNMTLAEAFTGIPNKEFYIPLTRPCDSCEWESCAKCKGNGYIQIVRSTQGFHQVQTVACDHCREGHTGTGWAVCSNTNVIRENTKISLDLPRSLATGNILRVAGKGNARARYITADILISINVTPDANFTREDYNLRLTVSLTLLEALNGYSKEVVLLDGKKIVLKFGGVTQPNFEKTFKNFGMYHIHQESRGNMVVVYNVVLPERTDTECVCK
jgi:DnaJ-class molecular chaperone